MSAVKNALDPDQFESELTSLAAETTIILAKQIIDVRPENPETLENDLRDFFPLGYLTGFILQILNWSEIKGTKERTAFLELSSQFIFGKTAEDVSHRIFDQLVSQEKPFQKGIESGGMEAQNFLDSNEEPRGLKNYLVTKI